jgi:ribose-phosphate pyrophosphokinase
VFAGDALERLRSEWLQSIIVTDSVPQPAATALPLRIVSMAPLLADVIGKLHRRESLSDLIAYE